MHAHRLRGGQSQRRRCSLLGVFILLAFGTSVLNLPIHLVHHFDEVNPHCQFLLLSAALSSSLLDEGWSPTIDRHWDELIIPSSRLDVLPHREPSRARAPPAFVRSLSR